MSADFQMPVKSPRRSLKLDSAEEALKQNPLVCPQFGIFSKNQTVIRAAEYIGSFLVTGKGHHDRAEVVRQKLEAARSYTHSKPIVLLISLQGIKVCRDNDEHVYMAHALRRISYATCDPDNLQFAFLAREPKAQPNIQYCHAFVTNTAEEAEELNNIVGEAFRVAYAQQRLAMLSDQMRNSVVAPSSTKTVLGPAGPEQPKPCSSSARPAPTGRENQLTHAVQSTELINGSELRSTEPTSHSSPHRFSDSTPTAITAHASMMNKPLPPVPISVSQLPDAAITHSVAITSSGSDPPVVPATATEDGPREHKLHKHHKHHKHRHRHKIRDSTGAPGVTADTSTSISGDSGRHTGTSESLADSIPPSVQDASVNQITGCYRTQQPPPPPPRGSSSITTSVVEEQPTKNGFPPLCRLSKVSASGSAGVTNIPSSEAVNSPIDLAVNSFGEVPLSVRITPQLSAVDKTKQPNSRPLSHHSYDMADHRSCGAMVTTNTGSSDVPNPLPLPSVSSPQMTHTSAVTTASSSTTGCSTTTSGSTHSGSGSGHSLPGPRRSGGESRSCGSSGSCPNSGRYSLSRLPLPPEVTDQENAVHHGSGSILGSLDESAELSQAPWYQPHVPREVALEILSRQPPGSFVIRDSGSHANCYALSVRFGEGAGRCSVSGQGPGLTRLGMSHGNPTTAASPAYPFAGTGISHFLIQRTARGGVRLKGLEKEWPSLACLVLHLTVMPEMLPCPLRLPKSAANPAFDAEDQGDAADAGLACTHFRPILDAPPRCGVDGCGVPNESATSPAVQEDEDYQLLSDFSSIMADLLPRTRTNRHATGRNRSGRGR